MIDNSFCNLDVMSSHSTNSVYYIAPKQPPDLGNDTRKTPLLINNVVTFKLLGTMSLDIDFQDILWSWEGKLALF